MCMDLRRHRCGVADGVGPHWPIYVFTLLHKKILIVTFLCNCLSFVPGATREISLLRHHRVSLISHQINVNNYMLVSLSYMSDR